MYYVKEIFTLFFQEFSNVLQLYFTSQDSLSLLYSTLQLVNRLLRTSDILYLTLFGPEHSEFVFFLTKKCVGYEINKSMTILLTRRNSFFF